LATGVKRFFCLRAKGIPRICNSLSEEVVTQGKCQANLS
jgi:hypothetical protein